jgi:hypothetical protein
MRHCVRWGHVRLLVAGCAAAAVLGCSTEEVLTGLVKNREYVADSLTRPLTVSQAKDTFLIRSSRIFYPDGIPKDPAHLPDFTEPQKQAIQSLLQASLQRVQSTQERHAALIAKHFTGFAPPPAKPRLQLLNQGQAVAGTDSSGLVLVDMKVVQAIYRSALLFVLGDERELGPQQERLAFERFAEMRGGLDGMSGLLPFSDLKGFAQGAREAGGRNPLDAVMSGLVGVLESRLTDAAFVGESRRLESSFLGAIDFLLAHETAHVALRHFPATDQCALAQQRELDADRHAVLLNLLASYDAAGRIVVTVSGGSISARGAGAAAILAEPPQSHEQFFRHAYRLAGFHAALEAAKQCEYPDTAVRVKLAEQFAEPASEIVRSARWAAALRRSGDGDTLKVLGEQPFDTYYLMKVRDATTAWQQQVGAVARQDKRNEWLEGLRDGYKGKLDTLTAQKELLRDLFNRYYEEAP